MPTPPHLFATGRPLAECSLGDIAATLAGSTEVFRRHRLDFCCRGDVALQTAALQRGLAIDALVAELEALPAREPSAPPRSSAALIDHIVSRFHRAHRRELPELVRLSRRVEMIHRDHPEVPAGLAAALADLLCELELHMSKEEVIVFPLMRAGPNPSISHPIDILRHDHDGHCRRLQALERLAHGWVLPQNASSSWQALYVGVRKLVDDLLEHLHLENNVLFPRFAVGAGDREPAPQT